jgi:type II secretion system protein H
LRGFTLVELLVVLTILVLLAALAAPAFTRQYHEAKLQAAARDLVALMRYARSQAVVEGTTYRLNIDRDGGRLWITRYENQNTEPGAEPMFVRDESVLGAERKLPEQVKILELQLGDEALAQLSDEALEAMGADRGRPNEEGTPYIAFTPAGTTDGARILVANDYEDRLVVTLDAITGRSAILEEDEES